MFQSIKQFLASWLQSLKFFTPAHGKLFFLVTFKTIYESYVMLFKKFWWLFLICIGFDVLYKAYSCSLGMFNGTCIISLLLWSVLGFVTFLTVRPSIALKNYDYYGNYFRHFLYFLVITYSLLLFLFLLFVIDHLSFVLISLSLVLGIFIPILTLSLFSPLMYISPFWMMLIFSSLDSENTTISQIKAIWRGIKMVFYNYPFLFIMTIIIKYGLLFTRNFMLTILMWLPMMSGVVSGRIMHIMADDLATLILPIFFCFVSNFYIKQVHEEFKRYF